MAELAPFTVFFAGALLAAVMRGRARSIMMLLVPVIAAWQLYTMGDMHITMHVFNYDLTIVKVDKLSLLFGYLFCLAGFLGVLYNIHEKDTMQHVSALIYAGSAMGAVFAGDLITFWLFWELLAYSSVFLILARRTAKADSASMRYLMAQILSGLVLLAGILLRIHETGSIAFEHIGLSDLSSALILIGLGIKCAFPAVHNWMTDAYPEATPAGTVMLSAFTTKVAVYALARSFAGTEILIEVGVIMAVYPIFFAVIENDLRRVLSYSMMNQIGFMVCGIGLGTDLGVNGAVAHAFNDVIFKGLLFMSMGAVLLRTGKVGGASLGGLYKSMPWTTGFCIVGALSISAFPLFSGFVSKSMILVSLLEQGHPTLWLFMLFASAGVLEHAGIKIPYFAFFAHDSGIRCKEAPWNMLFAMAIAAFVCIFNGAYPAVLYSMLPRPVDFMPYTAPHVLTQIQLLLFASLAVVVLMRIKIYPPELPSINLDVEWLYRKPLPLLLAALGTAIRATDQAVRAGGIKLARTAIIGAERIHGVGGPLGRTLAAGNMVFWVIAVLFLYLVLLLF